MGGQVSASGGGYDPNVDPGSINPPAIFEPSTALLNAPSPQVWVAASGGADWGGCLVSISFDGVNYDYIGTIASAAYQGVLTADLPAASGLDTADTLAIDLTESAGIFPTSATDADADAYRTLCYICPNFSGTNVTSGGELLAYGAVSATGTYTNDLTYLQRGLYGTTRQAFTGGGSTPAFFTRIDLGEVNTPPNSVIAWTLPAQYIGATIYFKFQSFNSFGNALEDISTVQEYAYVPTGTGYGGGSGGTPSTPTGLTGTTIHSLVALQWVANPPGDHVEYYNVQRATTSGGPYTTIANPTTNAYTDATVVSGTIYYYVIEAVNAAGTSATCSPVSVTAT